MKISHVRLQGKADVSLTLPNGLLVAKSGSSRAIADHDEINRLNAGRDQQQVLARQELRAITSKLDGLIEAIAEGLRGAGLQQKLDDLEARKAALEQSLVAAPPPAPRLHPNLAEFYRQKVEQL